MDRRCKHTDAEVVSAIQRMGVRGAAKFLGKDERHLHRRRRYIERKRRQAIPVGGPGASEERYERWIAPEYPGTLSISVHDGIVIVGSDCHYWPGPPSLMHRCFVEFCKEMKPKLVVLNGDVCDLPGISKYPPIGWQKLPEPAEELEACEERLDEIAKASFRAHKVWTLGNHDQRFSTYIATNTPRLARIKGVSLKDHFPLWAPCWAIDVNHTCLIKHRFRGGIHAPRNNALYSGTSMITGHLHSQQVSAITDYRTTRWGVDTGCIADPRHAAFLDYTEGNPKDWRDGFAVLTFRAGRLQPPELVCRWSDNEVVFRGQIIRV